MNLRRPWRQTAGSLAVVCLLVVFILGTRWSSIQRAVSGFDFEANNEPAAISPELESFGEEGLPGDLAEESWEMYTSMPVCADLREALHELTEARDRLIQQAAGTDAEALRAASSEYRQAIQHVQMHVERLRARVPPDVFPELAVELFNEGAAVPNHTFFPWETDSAVAGAE